ncbi:hypothetical protein C8J56DRAFT_800792 [Mycena floridula]|nr:hypothetical protein C8J56DRAFT_800792 [Mycena floridula]
MQRDRKRIILDTVYRDKLTRASAANFSDPEIFSPDRWLDSTALKHDLDAFMPFSASVGICIGKSVALHNLKLLVANMIRSFEMEFSAGFHPRVFDDSYKEHNLWKHDSLLVKMRPVEKSI